MSKQVDTRIPEDVYKRLKVYKARRGLTWTGVLVEASEELPDDSIEVEA